MNTRHWGWIDAMSNIDTERKWKEVDWFATQMTRKLNENVDKGHWDGTDLSYLVDRLREEVDEVEEAYDNLIEYRSSPMYANDDDSDWDSLLDECADVANFAMMIADHARARTGL